MNILVVEKNDVNGRELPSALSSYFRLFLFSDDPSLDSYLSSIKDEYIYSISESTNYFSMKAALRKFPFSDIIELKENIKVFQIVDMTPDTFFKTIQEIISYKGVKGRRFSLLRRVFIEGTKVERENGEWYYYLNLKE